MERPQGDKDRILGVARNLIPQLGLALCTNTDLELSGGLSFGTVRSHFSDNTDLFAALVRLEQETLLSRLKNAIAGETTPLKQLRALVRSRLVHLRELSDLFIDSRDLARELLTLAEGERKPYLEQELELVCSIVLQGCQIGHFDLDDPESGAAAIVDRAKRLELPTLQGYYRSLFEGVAINDLVDNFLKTIAVKKTASTS